jgi:hypothetical protein
VWLVAYRSDWTHRLACRRGGVVEEGTLAPGWPGTAS